MSDVVLIGFFTLAASFCCSLFEAALYAVSPSQVELLRKQKRFGSRKLASLRADIEEPIAAILTVNTIAHTVGSAWCGALVGSLYGSRAFGVFAAVFTVLVLALTEIVPKSVGFRYAAYFAPRVAWPIQWMIWAVMPIARPARSIMRALTGGDPNAGPSEEEIVVFAKLAAQKGAVRGEEQQWVQNALRLDKLTAGDLRTPRPVVETMPAEMTVAEAIDQTSEWTHSRVPIMETGGQDQILGLIFRREIFDAAVQGFENKTLRDFVHEISWVPETMPGHDLLRFFLNQRKHLVAVADEYGSFEGIVTLEDVLEALLGEEIVDEHDEVEDMQALARKQKPELGS
ncbi:MAG: HlyC/CorC family transporter [Planctomycetota bacterium]|nr:MAG: HlyC/CorC family transporter [Planctomycetota bacterium]